LEQLAREQNVEIEWRAFELRPLGTEVPPKSEAYMQRAWENVLQLCRQVGIPDMRQSSRRSMHSRLALEAQKFAAAAGQAEAFTRAVFQAVFYDDQDIADPETLTALAAGAGLDAAALRTALEQRQYSAAVEADAALAARWGITAIPCFVSPEQQRGSMGVQSYDDLVALLAGPEPQQA